MLRQIRLPAWENALPGSVVVALWLNAYIFMVIPPVWQVERLWLEWLGHAVYATGKIPNALGFETITAHGAPWLPQEWLFALLVAAANDHHMNMLLHCVIATIGIVPLVVTWLRLRAARIGLIQITCALALLGFCLDTVMQLRASIVGYAGAALIFAALYATDRRIFAVPLIVVIVANVHASALFLALLPLFTVPFVLAGERTIGPASRRMAGVAALSLLASLCTPFGTKLWTYAVGFSAQRTVHGYIQEWQPLFTGAFSTHLVYLLITGLLLLLFIRSCFERRAAPLDYALVALTLAMEIYAVRFEVFFATAVIPIIFSRKMAYVQAKRTAQILGAGVALLVIYFVSWRIDERLRSGAIADPLHPGLRVAKIWRLPYRIGNAARQRVFCDSFGYCAIFLAAGASVYLDGRADPFPLEVWKNWDGVRHVTPGSEHGLLANGINVILAPDESKLAYALAHNPRWKKFEHDDDQIAFVRAQPKR